MKRTSEAIIYTWGTTQLRSEWVVWRCSHCERKLKEGVEGSPDAEKPDYHYCPYCGRIFVQATA